VILALVVSVAAGLGAVLRYVVDVNVQHRVRGEFPYGTLVINLTGSLFLGIVTGLSLHHGLPKNPTLILGTGLAGGYTTLSTWAVESLALAQKGSMAEAGINVVGSFVLGMAAAAAGLGLALL
jgi:fluoride exporter